METPDPPMPTDAELAILRVLWQQGPSTVREVQAGLDRAPDSYTTVLKQLQIMHEKGLVTRDESSRAHVYHPAVAQEDTQRRLVDDLMDRAFGGSARQLVMRALSSEQVSTEELDEIRKLLDRFDTPPEDGAPGDDA